MNCRCALATVVLYTFAIISCQNPPILPPQSDQVFRSGGGDPIAGHQLSLALQRRFALIRIGMTRGEVNRHFKNDGGFAFDKRFILSQKPEKGQFVMFDVDFKPLWMDQRTYENPDRRVAWYKSHSETLLDPNDIVVAVSMPYLSGPHID